MNEPLANAWWQEEGVTCVSCPDCAFTFAAEQTNVDLSGYSCPACAELRLEEEVDRLTTLLSTTRGMVRNLTGMLIKQGMSMTDIAKGATGVEG